MSETNTSCTMDFGFSGTDFVRKYKIDDIADGDVAGIKTKIKAVNASLAGGTAGGLSSFFLSDDGTNFTSITAAKIDSVEIENINLN